MTALHEPGDTPQRLGFAVKVVGQPDLPANDARRWQNEPHLRISLRYLDAIFDYLERVDVHMYRMSSDLAPYVTHPDMPQFHRQIDQCADDLARLGARARAQGLRLSFHPSQFIVLNSPDETLVAKSIADLTAQGEMLDRMQLDDEAVLVTHVGGVYGDTYASRERWARTWETLPDALRRRLVLENDDTRFTIDDALWIHERTGVPVVFDYLHHWCLHTGQHSALDGLQASLATWPARRRPKIHFSSPRTENRIVERHNRASGKNEKVSAPPIWSGHADYINPFEFITFLRAASALRPFDVMLECKLKDVALLRLRSDLQRYGQDVAQRFGLVDAPLTAS